MDETAAIAALTALAQPTRLAVFRTLVGCLPEALPAGAIATRLTVPHNTMSTHLAILKRAGLASVTRDGRSMHYRADLAGFGALIAFLSRDCCGGRAELCASILDPIVNACSCAPETINGRTPAL